MICKPENAGRTKAVIFAVLAAVFLSACVARDVRTDSNNGLSISKFFADPESADSGDIVTVYMEIENVGERTAKTILLELISSAFEGQQIGVLQRTEVGIGKPLPEFSATRTERNYYFESLAPPDAEKNRPGDFRIVNWPLQAPFIPEGVLKEFRILGRLTYEYSTSSVVTIPVYTKNEFRQRTDVKSLEKTDSNGPLKVEVSGPQQIVVSTDPDAISVNRNQAEVYTITVKNAGDGIPITNGINGLVKGSMKFVGGITPANCLNEKQEVIPTQLVSRGSQQTYESGAYIINLPENEDGLVLRNGESVTFSCTLVLDRGQWIFRPFGTATIAFDMGYIYFIEKETTVTVKGVRA